MAGEEKIIVDTPPGWLAFCSLVAASAEPPVTRMRGEAPAVDGVGAAQHCEGLDIV